MSSRQEVRVPDLGDFDEVEIVEIMVQPGTEVAAEDPLITLETDKAAMEVPSPQAGTDCRDHGRGRRPRIRPAT